MGWSVGFDPNWRRDVGYGVPSICDHPGCGKEIDRGLSYVCGGDVYGGEYGCGLFFCGDHVGFFNGPKARQVCERCREDKPPFTATPDTSEWNRHKLEDESWGPWRDQNPDEVRRIAAIEVVRGLK